MFSFLFQLYKQTVLHILCLATPLHDREVCINLFLWSLHIEQPCYYNLAYYEDLVNGQAVILTVLAEVRKK